MSVGPRCPGKERLFQRDKMSGSSLLLGSIITGLCGSGNEVLNLVNEMSGHT
ncbi:hypothetical protein YC2023_067493 [Brassica napus]